MFYVYTTIRSGRSGVADLTDNVQTYFTNELKRALKPGRRILESGDIIVFYVNLENPRRVYVTGFYKDQISLPVATWANRVILDKRPLWRSLGIAGTMTLPRKLVEFIHFRNEPLKKGDSLCYFREKAEKDFYVEFWGPGGPPWEGGRMSVELRKVTILFNFFDMEERLFKDLMYKVIEWSYNTLTLDKKEGLVLINSLAPFSVMKAWIQDNYLNDKIWLIEGAIPKLYYIPLALQTLQGRIGLTAAELQIFLPQWQEEVDNIKAVKRRKR